MHCSLSRSSPQEMMDCQNGCNGGSAINIYRPMTQDEGTRKTRAAIQCGHFFSRAGLTTNPGHLPRDAPLPALSRNLNTER